MDNETKKELDRLWKLYYEKDKEFEAAKMKRLIVTWLGFAAVFLLLFLYTKTPSGAEIIESLIVSLILSGLYTFVNVLVFGVWLCNKGRNESDSLAAIKKRIDELNNK